MVKEPLLEFADRINEIIPILMKGFARRQFYELYKIKISLPQFFVLQFLARESGSKMTELARIMGVSTPAMTGIIDRLVKSGYVVRVFDPKDRRIIKVKITAKGNELVNKVNEQRRRMVISIFGKISASDREDYLRVLMKIKDIIIKESSDRQ